MIKHLWTEEDEQWIRDNHAKMPSREIAARFGVQPSTYGKKRREMGIVKHRDHEHSINMTLLQSIQDPQVAYALGFMWADGSLDISRKQDGSISSMAFRMGGCKADFVELQPIMRQIGDMHVWMFPASPASGHRQDQLHFTSHDQAFCRFLYEIDFHIKRINAPSKLLAQMPDHLHSAFWHGFFDGDGCLCVIRRSRTAQLSFCGAEQQDWSALTSRLTQLGLTWREKKEQYVTRKGATHSCSKVLLSGRRNIQKLTDYMFRLPPHGLSRKRLKAEQLDQWIQERLTATSITS